MSNERAEDLAYRSQCAGSTLIATVSTSGKSPIRRLCLEAFGPPADTYKISRRVDESQRPLIWINRYARKATAQYRGEETASH
jgi:hypothetical protein